MIAMKLGWLMLEALLCWFFLYFGSGAALALAALMVLVPLGTVFVNLHLKKKIRLSLVATSSVRKGDEGTVTIRLENPTIFPVLRIQCNLEVRNLLNRENCLQKVVTYVRPKGSQTCRVRINSPFCGRIQICTPMVVLYDCFGLIGIRLKTDATAHMTVLPDTFEPVVELVPNPSSTDDSESYSQERPGSDLTETFQIREYVQGDSLKQIHWKLTGKLDKMIVRDPGLPVSKNVLVFWERSGESEDFERIDAQAEVVISLCRSLVDRGIQFHMAWNDPERNLCIAHRIQDMDEFVGITPQLLRATGKKDAPGGAGLLIQSRPDVLCAHMVYVAENGNDETAELQRYGHVTMLLCGENGPQDAICFNEYDYTEQLTHISI